MSVANSFGNRLSRADAIVATGEIVKSGRAWLVPSQSSDAVYRVTMGEHGPECTCEDFKARRTFCKHAIAASRIAQAQQSENAHA